MNAMKCGVIAAALFGTTGLAFASGTHPANLKGAVFGDPARALANAVHSEIVLAEQHAGLAAQSMGVALVHTHLHHTLNCLVGPGGPGFDAQEINPCANVGHGAIPDSVAAKQPSLEAAAAEARAGIDEPVLAKAQQHAAATETMLKKAE
jgi:hypothetical protein